MKSWARLLGFLGVIVVIAAAYFVGRAGGSVDEADTTAINTPDPGYAARDAEVIETGYDGRERYRLKAKVIHQQTETSAIDLEQLEMSYHVESDKNGGKPAADAAKPAEIWHLTSDRGQVRADGDDVQLSGNVRVTGPAPGTGEPLSLTTDNMRINTPTEYIETTAPVKLRWAGQELNALGMQADLKAGTLRLESDVHGSFSQK